MEEKYENAVWVVEDNGQHWDYGTFNAAEAAQAAFEEWYMEKCNNSGEYKNGDTHEIEIELVLMSDNDEELERKTATVDYECYHGDLKEHGTYWGKL